MGVHKHINTKCIQYNIHDTGFCEFGIYSILQNAVFFVTLDETTVVNTTKEIVFMVSTSIIIITLNVRY